MQSRTGGKHQ